VTAGKLQMGYRGADESKNQWRLAQAISRKKKSEVTPKPGVTPKHYS
jgi:hypothetical protein